LALHAEQKEGGGVALGLSSSLDVHQFADAARTHSVFPGHLIRLGGGRIGGNCTMSQHGYAKLAAESPATLAVLVSQKTFNGDNRTLGNNCFQPFA
jgi:hypothetical protein